MNNTEAFNYYKNLLAFLIFKIRTTEFNNSYYTARNIESYDIEYIEVCEYSILGKHTVITYTFSSRHTEDMLKNTYKNLLESINHNLLEQKLDDIYSIL